MPTPLPASWLSVDPGDRYVGVARWAGSSCQWTEEQTPEQFAETLVDLCGLLTGVRLIEVLVQEKFALYGWNEKSLAGNEFLTCQMIGMTKFVCAWTGVKYVGQFAAQGKMTYRREPFKHWTAKQWQEALGGPIGKGHTKDAYAHGAHFIYMRDNER